MRVWKKKPGVAFSSDTARRHLSLSYIVALERPGCHRGHRPVCRRCSIWGRGRWDTEPHPLINLSTVPRLEWPLLKSSFLSPCPGLSGRSRARRSKSVMDGINASRWLPQAKQWPERSFVPSWNLYRLFFRVDMLIRPFLSFVSSI